MKRLLHDMRPAGGANPRGRAIPFWEVSAPPAPTSRIASATMLYRKLGVRNRTEAAQRAAAVPA